MPSRKIASKANAEIAETQSLTRKSIRARKPTQKLLEQQQQESETEESELSEIEEETELEEVEESEKELAEANDKLAKKTEKSIQGLTLKEIRMLVGGVVNIVMLLFAKQEIAGRNFILLDDFGALLIRFGNVVVEMMIVEDAEAEN